MNVQGKTRTINAPITRRVIELQAKGYDCDFYIIDSQLVCIQNNQVYPVWAVLVEVIDQVYDYFSRSYKYIHTVDTNQGDKGLIVIEGIITN
jgi:hypothetical protein